MLPAELWSYLRQCKAAGYPIRAAICLANERFYQRTWFKKPISYGYAQKVYCSNRDVPPAPTFKAGRPRKLSNTDRTWLRIQCKRHKIPGRARNAKLLAADLPTVIVHPKTVRREIKRWGDTRRIRPRKRIWLTAYDRRRRRLAAARLRSVCIEFWRQVSFTDEKRFSASGPDSPELVWAVSGFEPERYIHTSSAVGIMVWAALTPSGLVGPIILTGGLSAERYIDLLEDVLDRFDGLFYDDWASAHRANKTVQYTNDQGLENIRFSLSIPPKLLEVNPLENVWSYIQRRTYEGNRSFSSNGELWARVQAVCAQIKESGEDRLWFNKLTATIPRRMEAIIAAKGRQVDYLRYDH